MACLDSEGNYFDGAGRTGGMHGIAPPLVTPFDADGDVDYDRLRDVVAWVEGKNVNFILACGSTSEAPLLTSAERRRVVETVVDAASVPVLAGTGHPGLRETIQSTEAAAEAGADAALVVTPFYYPHDQSTLAAYYRELAESVSLPIYLYSVPQFTNVALEPDTVMRLSARDGILGIKDSAGDIARFVRTVERSGEGFDCFVGSTEILADALKEGAAGGILALANLVPERLREVYLPTQREPERVVTVDTDLVKLNQLVTSEYGIPGLKWAMRQRDVPAGYARSPHQRVGEEGKRKIGAALRSVL